MKFFSFLIIAAIIVSLAGCKAPAAGKAEEGEPGLQDPGSGRVVEKEPGLLQNPDSGGQKKAESSPSTTAKCEKPEMPEEGPEYPGAAGDGGKDESAPTGQNGGNKGDYFDFLRKELENKYKYIENDPNGLSGYDINGDGRADAYIDENGKLRFHKGFDDLIDDSIDLSDVEWGQG
ncbi:MAG: hypothetical protein ACM3XR_10735 [Bacillota bacterium]